jgi:outer membrane scaffolding protein for murein synthesis (MipA/OmpV family)
MKKISRVMGALSLVLISSQSFAKYADQDFTSLRPTRTVASVEPADLTPTTHVDRGPALFELGIGLGGALDPHYPGSDQSQVIVLPFPFAVYRGRIVQSDRRGTRARLWTAKGFDVSLSGTGAFPVKSNDDNARRGMEDLGWGFQLGPKLRLGLREWSDGAVLRAGLSVRGAFSANYPVDITSRGYVFEPEIVYQKPDAFAERLDLFSSLSATFATAGYMDYIYGVRPGDVTADRREYAATGGYLESVFQAGLSYRTIDNRHKFVFSSQVGSLEGATNRDSPLVRSTLDLTVGVAWVWTFFESEEKAVIVD